MAAPQVGGDPSLSTLEEELRMACLGLDLVAEGLGPGGRWLRGRADPLKVLGRQKGTLSTAGLPVSPAGVLPASQPS